MENGSVSWTVKVTKSSGSLFIRLPKTCVEALDIEQGDYLNVFVSIMRKGRKTNEE
jgi:antitoxin component of MazEF toxin-antitoxin module